MLFLRSTITVLKSCVIMPSHTDETIFCTKIVVNVKSAGAHCKCHKEYYWFGKCHYKMHEVLHSNYITLYYMWLLYEYLNLFNAFLLLKFASLNYSVIFVAFSISNTTEYNPWPMHASDCLYWFQKQQEDCTLNIASKILYIAMALCLW